MLNLELFAEKEPKNKIFDTPISENNYDFIRKKEDSPKLDFTNEILKKIKCKEEKNEY